VVETILKEKPPRDPYRFMTLTKGVFSFETNSVFNDIGDEDIKEKWKYYMVNGYKIHSISTLRQGGIFICFIKED